MFGTIIGSFLNVVLYRFRGGMTLGGRSKCLSCGKTLKPRMLVPLFSYLFQRGRCAYCGAKLSVQYPIVEALSGVIFAYVAFHYGIGTMLPQARELALFTVDVAIGCLLLVITVYDLRHKIILDGLVLCFVLLSLGRLLITLSTPALGTLHYMAFFGMLPWWFDLLAGPLLALPFALLWFFSGGRAMGLGDAKLAWGIGWFLGFAGGLSAIVVSFWIAFFPSLYLLYVARKRYTMKSEIPFAPFLVLGSIVIYITGIDILSWVF